MKKIAFCDFDGTLSNGYISMGFMDYLLEKGAYPQKSYDRQMKLYDDMKKGRMSYDDWCEQWGIEWAQGLKGQTSYVMNLRAFEFFNRFRKNIYPSSYLLMNYLKEKEFSPVGVSVGTYEVIKRAVTALNMDEAFATMAEVKNNVYTGEIYTRLHLPTGKIDTLRDFAREKNINLQDCVAMGDSASDVGMLEMVGTPIALNPSEELLKIARERRWTTLYYYNVMSGIKRILD